MTFDHFEFQINQFELVAIMFKQKLPIVPPRWDSNWNWNISFRTHREISDLFPGKLFIFEFRYFDPAISLTDVANCLQIFVKTKRKFYAKFLLIWLYLRFIENFNLGKGSRTRIFVYFIRFLRIMLNFLQFYLIGNKVWILPLLEMGSSLRLLKIGESTRMNRLIFGKMI